MTVTSPSQTTTPAQAGVTAPAEPPRRRRTFVIGASVLIVAAAAVGGFALRGNGASSGASDNADRTSVTEVAQGTLVSQTQVEATLGYTGSYSIVNAAQGTLTWLPSIGQIVSQGQTLYDVNGTPVVLLYGATPAYRTLSEGVTDGADIEQLNADLVALRYVSAADLNPSSDVFSYGTKVGVEKLQKALGETENGTLTLGQFLFESSAVRVTGLGTNTVLGGAAQPGTPILTGTSTARVVTIDLDADDEGDVALGDPVTITLPDNSTTPGKVSSVGTVASTSDDSSPGGSGDPTITVLVTPTDSAATGNLDQAPVEVTITTDSDKDTLYVPVDALLALSGGGYGIETIGAKGAHNIVPVSLGLFDDNAGTVAVAGSGLQVGQRIVIPASS